MMKLSLSLLVLTLLKVSLGRPIPRDLSAEWTIEIQALPPEGEGGRVSAGPFAEDCEEFCTHTYPQHTYSEPEDFRACEMGCRSAQVNSFISWPLKADSEICTSGCSEAYSSKDQQFACKMGCKTTTVDSALPDFTHLYSSQNSSDILELDIGPSLGTIWSSLLQSFISNSDSGGNAVDFYSLNEHAENMNRLAAPYRHSDVTIFTSDGVYRYHQYSFTNKNPVEITKDRDGNSPLDDMHWISGHHDNRIRFHNCLWLRHRALLGKILMIFIFAFALLALVTCCLSLFKRPNQKDIVQKVPVVTSPPFSKKAPYDIGPQFISLHKI